MGIMSPWLGIALIICAVALLQYVQARAKKDKVSIKVVERFTVDAALQDAGQASNGIAIGPLLLQGPTVGLGNLGFKDGQLVVTIGIGVDTASLNFGGGTSNQAQPSARWIPLPLPFSSELDSGGEPWQRPSTSS